MHITKDDVTTLNIIYPTFSMSKNSNNKSNKFWKALHILSSLWTIDSHLPWYIWATCTQLFPKAPILHESNSKTYFLILSYKISSKIVTSSFVICVLCNPKVHPRKIAISENSPWKFIKTTGFVPIGCYGRRIGCSVVVPISKHDDYVTDKCSLKMTERSRKKYGFYVKAVKDFKKSGKKSMILHFGPIRTRPGGSKFWLNYRLPSIKVILWYFGSKEYQRGRAILINRLFAIDDIRHWWSAYQCDAHFEMCIVKRYRPH